MIRFPTLGHSGVSESHIGKEEKAQAIQRILKSQAFGRSETLCRFIEFVGEQSIEGNYDHLKEYTIATEALGRSKEYDPSCDSVVRVQANRVRTKLQQYYETEGIEDPILIQLPQGKYHLGFSRRRSARLQAKWVLAWAWNHAAFVALSVACVTFFGLWLSALGDSEPPEVRAAKDPALAALWGDFFDGANTPWIVYSNSLFLATDSGDLLHFHDDARYRFSYGARVNSNLEGLQRFGEPVATKSGLYYADVYSGVGEVVSSALVGSLFTRFNKPFSVKRSRFVDIQDLKNRDVIVLGSQHDNAILKRLPRRGELVFAKVDPKRCERQMVIRDLKPKTGSPSVYGLERDEATSATKVEHALVSVMEGVTPGRNLMILAGLSTLGTQGATEYMTSRLGAREVLNRMGILDLAKGQVPKYFQVLLRVEVADGTPVRTQYVTHKILKTGAPLITQARR